MEKRDAARGRGVSGVRGRSARPKCDVTRRGGKGAYAVSEVVHVFVNKLNDVTATFGGMIVEKKR